MSLRNFFYVDSWYFIKSEEEKYGFTNGIVLKQIYKEFESRTYN